MACCNPAAVAPEQADSDIKTDHYGRSRTFKVHSFKRPWFRAFHFSWFSFFLAFTGWFAIVPALEYIIADQTNDITVEVVKTSNILSVLATVFLRFLMGPLCESYGPRRLQCIILAFGAICVMLSATINSAVSLYIFRFLIGFVGAAFVPCQYWTTMMFSGDVVGQANAFAGGWGNLGGGFTNIFVAALIVAFQVYFEDNLAWRFAMLVPGIMMLSFTVPMWLISDDCPQGHWKKRVYNNSYEYTKEGRSLRLKEAAEPWTDWRVWLLFAQYAACFGIELTINNSMTSYLFRYFLLDTSECQSFQNYSIEFNSTLESEYFDHCSVLGKNNSALIAGLFGLMNLFARSLGGLASDRLNRYYKMRGRIFTQFICLFMEGIMLIIFSRVADVSIAIPMLLLFSLFVQASEGSTFALVPFVCKNIGTVAGIVGAGGSVGAVSWSSMIKIIEDMRDAYLYLGFIVIAISFFSFLIPIHGTYLTCGQNDGIDEKITKVDDIGAPTVASREIRIA